MKSARPTKMLSITLVGVLLLILQFSPVGTGLEKLIQGTQDNTPANGQQTLLVEPANIQPAAPSQIPAANPHVSRSFPDSQPPAAVLSATAPEASPAALEHEAASSVVASRAEANADPVEADAQTSSDEVKPASPQQQPADTGIADIELEGAGGSKFRNFVKSVSDGQASAVRGIYVEDVFELPVIQQPVSNAAFVSEQKNVVTQFQSASEYGVTGLLAHNFLSGLKFYNLQIGQIIRIVYGDSSIRSYQITELVQYQKLSPSNLRSDLIDLSTGEQVTSETVFTRVYRGKHHLTLQTCLERNGISNWGLSFWIATPVETGF